MGIRTAKSTFARSCVAVTLAAAVAAACGSERPPAGEGGGAGGSARGASADAGGVTAEGGDESCVSGAIQHSLSFAGRRAPGAACCPGTTASDCQPFACVCADGNARGCTFGCVQSCTGGTCTPTGCDDPMRLCAGAGDLCTGHGGVTGVRPAFSFDDCEGAGGAKDAGAADAAPADAAADARIVFPPGQ